MLEIHIFDFDGTLTKAPSLADFLETNEEGKVDINRSEFSKNFNELKNFFYLIFSKEIKFIKDEEENIIIYDSSRNSPLGSEYIEFIDELDRNEVKAQGFKRSFSRDVIKKLEGQNGKLKLKKFSDFYNHPETIGDTVGKEQQEAFEVYKKAKNKMIVTGRDKKLEEEIKNALDNIGLPMPNYGLFLYDGSYSGIPNFKKQIVEDTIQENDWEKVHFYEDRKKWLDEVSDHINNKFPKVTFISHLIN